MKYEHVSLSRRDDSPLRNEHIEGKGRGVTRINRVAKWISRRRAGSVTRRRVSKHRGGCRQSGRCIKGRRVNGQLGSTGSTTFSLHPLLPKELSRHVAGAGETMMDTSFAVRMEESYRDACEARGIFFN